MEILEVISSIVKDWALVIVISVLVSQLKYDEHKPAKLLFVCLLFLL